MKAITFHGIQDLRYEEVPDPAIQQPDEVMVKVVAAGICGSDLSRYRKLGPHLKGNVWGHELAGEVVEVGTAVESLAAGDRVVAGPALVCGRCEPCRGGHLSQCERLSTIGAFIPGAFAEYIKLPAHMLAKMGPSMSYEAGALMEPIAVVLHGLYRTRIQAGYDVAVIGCGTIGLLAVLWAQQFGAKKIYALDIDDRKLALAQRLGAQVSINIRDRDVYEAIRERGRGADLAIEAAGSPFTAARAPGLARRGGEVLYLGIPYGDVEFPRFYFEQIVRYELTLYGSWSCVSAPYPGKEWLNAVELIEQKSLPLEQLVTHRVPLGEGPEIFRQIVAEPTRFGKVLLYPH